MLSEKNEVKFTINILEKTGDFTISEGSSIVSTGRVYIPEDKVLEMQDKLEAPVLSDENDGENMNELLTSKEIYKELRIRGYDYGPKFQGLIEARGDGQRGSIKRIFFLLYFLDNN